MEKELEFDYFQEVARSAFADMLHDEERNRKYSLALEWAIKKLKSQGKKANVLDIGTGSGLLAMLAARHGADSVVTLEAFSPTSSLAKKVIEANGYTSMIKIINKHSTAVEVGAGKDMEQKANILVAEVLDTELIGEGAIRTYNEAHQHLLEDGVLCVPHSAEIYAQIISSKLASSWFHLPEFPVNGKTLRVPNNVKCCRGLSSIHDLQLSQLPLSEFQSITDPIKICEIDFSGQRSIPYGETFSHKFKASSNSDSVVIFFWWNIHMTQSKDLLLSCAPHWAHPDTNQSLDEISRRNALPFRDHWMQGCYSIPRQQLEKDKNYTLRAAHDEFAWFFDLLTKSSDQKMELPTCDCIFHMCNSRNRISQFSDESKRLAFMEMMKRVGLLLKNVLFLGDHSLLPLIACHISSTGAGKIHALQENEFCFKSMKKFIEQNGLQEKIHLISSVTQIHDEQLTHVIVEPYFKNAVLPIDNVTETWTIIKKLRKMTSSCASPFVVLPKRAKIRAVPVHFLHLYKIRWPLGMSCEGFDHEYFDKVIECASEIADENVEAFSLWEYPCYALGEATDVFEVDFNGDAILERGLSNAEIDNFSRSCNGIAFWTEWMSDKDNDDGGGGALSTGPSESIVSGELINWKFDRQAVHLIPHNDASRGILRSVEIKSHFDAIDEKIIFDFSYNYAN